LFLAESIPSRKVDILVVYGFHPEEPLAERIGENLARKSIEGVKVIRFRPSYMPDNLHHLRDEEADRITLDGVKQLKKFIKENYNEVSFVLSLHETPRIEEPYRFVIHFPEGNVELENILQTLEKSCKGVYIVEHPLEAFPSHHSVTLEYFLEKGKSDEALVEDGEKFTLSLIDYLKKNYLEVYSSKFT
jgi:hypothetical protein